MTNLDEFTADSFMGKPEGHQKLTHDRGEEGFGRWNRLLAPCVHVAAAASHLGDLGTHYIYYSESRVSTLFEHFENLEQVCGLP